MTLHRTSPNTISHDNFTFVTESEGKKYECFQWHSMLKTIKKVTAFLISFFFFVSTDHRKKLETKQELVLVSSLKEWQCMKVLAPTQLIFNYWLKRHIVKKRTEARFTKINFLSNKIIFHLSFREKKSFGVDHHRRTDEKNCQKTELTRSVIKQQFRS